MSDVQDRATAAAETLVRIMSDGAARELAWRERAEIAQAAADAALERERAAARVTHDALVEAARAQAIATLAAAILPIDGLVGDAVSIARAALFGAEGKTP